MVPTLAARDAAVYRGGLLFPIFNAVDWAYVAAAALNLTRRVLCRCGRTPSPHDPARETPSIVRRQNREERGDHRQPVSFQIGREGSTEIPNVRQTLRVFTRDGFIDRYSGERLIFPAAVNHPRR
jgi:hypothetical protein